jgi:hypothetical protein
LCVGMVRIVMKQEIATVEPQVAHLRVLG